MSRFIVIGDPHAKPDNLDKIRKLCNQVEEYGLPAIWLGDLLDTKDIVRAQCLNTYYNYFKDSRLEHFVLTGNHDYINAECKDHALEPLKALKNVKIVDRPFILEHSGKSRLIGFLPYYRDNNKLRAGLQSIQMEGAISILIGHLDIKSFDYGNGFISEEGIHPEELKDYKLVISGHYHKYQKRDNIIYLGTPFSHNFGESNQDKYLGILDDETGGFCTIASDFPKHITVNLDASNPHQFDTNNRDHFRIILKGTREQIDNFDMTPYKGFKIIPEYVSIEHKSELKETQTPEDMFSKWFSDVKKETDQELHTLGLNILRDSK